MNQKSATERVSVSVLRQVDQICLRFEDQLQAGERPDLGAALADFPEADGPPLLAELLLLEWSYRVQSSESFHLEEYRRRLPALSTVVELAWQRWDGREGGLGATVAYVPNQPVPSADAPALVALPGYEALELLGKGGMGEVYKAFDPRLKRWVALKRVRLDQVRPDRLARFQREAEALARLAHPHIVKVHGYTESGGQPVLEMEYVAGGTLEERLGTTGCPPAEAARLMAILAWAVHAAHEKGIVHRDLKPANVLLDVPVPGNPGNVPGGFPKISDFGLATLADDSSGQTLSGTVLGTPAYMSPEQAAGKTQQIGPPADVWALGVMLYRCLTGVLPFQGDSVLDTLERVKTMPIQPVRELREEIPPELEGVCVSCLRKAAGERPTAAQLAARLDLLVGQTAVPARPHQAGRSTDIAAATSRGREKAAPPRRRWAGLAVAAGLAAATLLVVGVWLTIGNRPPPTTQGPGVRPDQEGPLTVALHVRHFRHDADGDAATAEIGKEFLEMHYNDRVVIQVDLSRPAHCFLIACNFDGKEQLLWPCDHQPPNDGDPNQPPRAVERLVYPPPPGRSPDGKTAKALGLALNDTEAGGTQAFVVVAARQPLPAYKTWAQKRGAIPWRHLPASPGVWRSSGETLDAMELGGLRTRGQVVPLEGQPPLLELCGWAKGDDVDVVESLTFPVYRRQGK